jgi:hypothetical protein
VFELDSSLIGTGPPTDDPKHPEPTPFDTTLDASATAAALGYQLPDLDQQLVEFRSQVETGHIALLGGPS